MHFQRNLLARVGKTNKPVVSAVVKTVFAETHRDQAHARWREVANSLRERFRDMAELMDGEGVIRSLRGSDRSPNEHDVLAYMAFDESLRGKLHSTNPLERVNKEIRRRTNVVGIFPNLSGKPGLVRFNHTKRPDGGRASRGRGKCKDAKAALRMLPIAMVLEGYDRKIAAEVCGMDRQTLRDWGEGRPDVCPLDRRQP